MFGDKLSHSMICVCTVEKLRGYHAATQGELSWVGWGVTLGRGEGGCGAWWCDTGLWSFPLQPDKLLVMLVFFPVAVSDESSESASRK